MTETADQLQDLLNDHIRNPRSSFSIGSFGAIAEFFHGADGDSISTTDNNVAVVTPAGSMRISSLPDALPVAYEGLSRDPECWTHGIAICLPRSSGICGCRTVITELGVDNDAIVDVNKNDRLFDLGVGATNVDFCVRTNDPTLITRLRKACGQPLFGPDTQILNCLLDASPHRIVISQLGRIEVYQPLSRDKTPSGPHTHLLPRLLRAQRSHDANVPIPKKFLPCFTLFPASPFFDHQGTRHPYRHDDQVAFATLLDQWGVEDYVSRKRHVVNALRENGVLDEVLKQGSRIERMATRVALRQVACERSLNHAAPGAPDGPLHIEH